MWRYLALILILALPAPAVSQEVPQPAEVERYLDDAMPAASAPGLAWALLENGQVRSGVRGERIAGSGQPVTDDTAFPLGSLSKSFTALAIMQQVEAGRLELDGGLADYLDVFEGQPGAVITIRQLLSHTSGYSTLQGNATGPGPDDEADTLAARVRQLARTAPAREAGTSWQYSNANYLILGALIETFSGLEYANYVETRILDPLGMDDSFVGGSDRGANAVVASGHTPWFGGRRALVAADQPTGDPMAPAGGIMGSAADVARYLAMMMNGEDDLITAEHKAMMLQPASALSPHYGLGWSLDVNSDVAFHTGLVPGAEAIAVLSPSQQRGGVVLVNANSGMGFGVTGDILAGMSALSLGEEPRAGGGHLGTQSLYLMPLVLLLFFLAGSVTAWLRRDGLRAKSGASGAFSLYFPVLATGVMAWVFLDLMPKLFGAPLMTFKLYQPDMVILLVASSVTGVSFAVFRLAVAYTGRQAG
ncbi:serine hydrolase [uncultured Maricaulis sp.]|uniref:serine hydrolase domain-containing protein n=1 Tax=uncultured Maricaulis sp. TaxID=174710 RepID=UPI002605D14D|nr:serine hydrolase domain-containing protein [uncultured Maricaulis sp.]